MDVCLKVFLEMDGTEEVNGQVDIVNKEPGNVVLLKLILSHTKCE